MTRIIRIEYPGSVFTEGLVTLTLPADMSAERLRQEAGFWSGVISKQEHASQQDFTKALLNALCNAIPGAKWESVTPFATLTINELT